MASLDLFSVKITQTRVGTRARRLKTACAGCRLYGLSTIASSLLAGFWPGTIIWEIRFLPAPKYNEKKKKGVTRFHYDPNACYPLFLLATLFFFFSPELDSRFNTQLEILKRKRKNNQMMFKSNTVTTSINIPDTLHSLINISLVTGLHLIKIQIAFII